MEDCDKLLTANEVNPPTETVGSVNLADSTSKICSSELLPDSTSEIENSHSQTQQLDSLVESNKLNGDCSVQCSILSPSSALPNNNNNTSTCKISTELSTSYKEISFSDSNDENSKYDSQKKNILPSNVDITNAGITDQSKNLSHSSQQICEKTLHCPEDELKSDDSLQCIDTSNINEVTSTLEEKTTCEASDATSTLFKTETKPAISKTKKLSTDSSPLFSNKSDSFKSPRQDLKTPTIKAKSNEITSLECGHKTNDVSSKATDKTTRNAKRKLEDKHINATSDVDLADAEKFPILYKGFKKKINNLYEKRLNLRWNPFNPACKANRKTNKCIPSRLPIGDEIDCSSLQQSEYAQYLGLQPILKFRCSNCGSSAFQSMVALNTHQIECTKSGKGKLDKIPQSLPSTISEPKSTNIKLTRKVFLCSACGTYYEHWNLFLHMREVHRRYICLYCLGMFSIAEKLSEHLIQKHKVTNQNFSNLEDFQKHSYQTFFMLCLTCDKVFSEMDDFYGHVCVTNKKNVDGNESSNKFDSTLNQESNATPTIETCANIGNKPITRRAREVSKRSAVTTRSSQCKKDEAISGNVQKSEDGVSFDCKEVTKSYEGSANNSSETNNCCTSEDVPSEPSPTNQNEMDTKTSLIQDIKAHESEVNTEGIYSHEKTKPVRKTKFFQKKASKRKKPKEKEEENESNQAKIKKTLGEEPKKETMITAEDENESILMVPETENAPEVRDELINIEVPIHQPLMQDINNEDILQECGEGPENALEEEKPDLQEVTKEEEFKLTNEASKEELTKSNEPSKEELTKLNESSNEELSKSNEPSKDELSTSSIIVNSMESNNKLHLLKLGMSELESDGESDDSQKLSLVVDENANSDTEHKVLNKSGENSATDSDRTEVSTVQSGKGADNNLAPTEGVIHDVTLASEDVAVMALTLDDKIENIPIQTVLKECVRTSCMSCNYCRHAVKIAVNGKQLALHILSEHRYMPIKNETPDDVIKKLRVSLSTLQTMFFNTETYDSSDSSIHVPYDQDSSFDCFQCNYVTTSHRDLFAHKRKSHTKSLLLCIMCKSNFYSYSELLCHLCPGTYNAEIQFHNIDINFRCCFCRLDTIPSAFRLMVHLRKTHHTCDICLENGVDQQKLSTHMWKHKLNHLCYRCGIAYASKPDITKHLFWKHGHESVLCKKCLQKKWPHVYHFCIPPNSFICEECNTSFSKAVALKVHKRIHGNDFPYTCAECNKKFVSKKLLQRHEERHVAIKNNIEQKLEADQPMEQKEETINVSDVINENKESSATNFSDPKEVEPKDKSHKKHKKDKDKKDKQVVDVYDLPPLNLSSESDSSDEDNSSSAIDNNGQNIIKKEENKEKTTILEKKEPEHSSLLSLSQNEILTGVQTEKTENKIASPETLISEGDKNVCVNIDSKDIEKQDNGKNQQDGIILPINTLQCDKENITNIVQGEGQIEQANQNLQNDIINNQEVEDIWKNFYSTNPQNSNLPYPLCAIKSDIALKIIMGDHDYCHQPIESPACREENPTTPGFLVPLINDQLEEIIEPPSEKVTDTLVAKDATNTNVSPINSPKKKPKSPKKKNSKGENENNSSSSSDSSSESSSSSCSCGPNCSCSSSSSNSSSSSSSDSESSAGEDGTKQEKKRKKRERRNKTKAEHEPELPKEEVQPEVEKIFTLEPIDPPIRESELETDETTTDEEFYDQQPQRIANQLLAEKRNQLMLLASAANVNNGNASPTPIVEILQPEIVPLAKQKVKTKRKRKITTKGKASSEKMSNSHSYSQYSKDNEPVSKQIPQYNNPLSLTETKLPQFVAQTPSLTETTGSGSETEKSRSSKRRRIPNKFYGYSSGDEEEKPTPSLKWRKQEIINQPTRVQPPAHPPTPRIQLTVPKQIIRKPYKFQKTFPKPQPSSSESTDSGSEMETQRTPQVLPPHQDIPTAATSQKNDKDVYCYCRCPYDEVSEMIACDDENCEIEWFHFECVGILVPPRGQWFCPGCRKARGLPT